MKDKIAPALFCLLFAVVFGGVGIFAAWTIGGTLYDGMRAKEWVRVKAFVDAHGEGRVAYRYTMGGRDYTGSASALRSSEGRTTSTAGTTTSMRASPRRAPSASPSPCS